jgi:hypothetical protein
MKTKNTFVYLTQNRSDSVTLSPNCLGLSDINCHNSKVTLQCHCDSSDKGVRTKETSVYLTQNRSDSVTLSLNYLRISDINCHKSKVTLQCHCDTSDKGGQYV